MSDFAASNDLGTDTARSALPSGRDAFGTPTFRPLVDGVVAFFAAVARHLHRAHVRRSTIRQLAQLDDRLLEDIGVRRPNIETFVDRLMARHESANENERHLAA